MVHHSAVYTLAINQDFRFSLFTKANMYDFPCAVPPISCKLNENITLRCVYELFIYLFGGKLSFFITHNVIAYLTLCLTHVMLLSVTLKIQPATMFLEIQYWKNITQLESTYLTFWLTYLYFLYRQKCMEQLLYVCSFLNIQCTKSSYNLLEFWTIFWDAAS